MWSMYPTPGLNPACSFLRSMAPPTLIWMIQQKISLDTEKSDTPRRFVHCEMISPFLGSLTISPLYQSSGMVSAFHILWNRS